MYTTIKEKYTMRRNIRCKKKISYNGECINKEIFTFNLSN